MRTHQYKQYLKGEADKETGKFESCTYVTSAEKSDLRVKMMKIELVADSYRECHAEDLPRSPNFKTHRDTAV